MSATQHSPLRMPIDVVSDVVCPWCFIGKRRLSRAIAMRPQIIFDVKWRPYRLDPTIPAGGLDRKAYMRAKFGDDPMKIVEMHKLIAAEAAKDGIEFDFAAIARRPDTLDSHRLIRWAEAAGVQDDVVERLFIAYFENGDDIGDIRVLADIADLCGMDGPSTCNCASARRRRFAPAPRTARKWARSVI